MGSQPLSFSRGHLAVFWSQLVQEMRAVLIPGRVQKVHQSAEMCVVFQIHAHGQKRALHLDAGPPTCAVITQHPPHRQTETAPAFQGLLRKYLAPSTILAIDVDTKRALLDVQFAAGSGAVRLLLEWPRVGANLILVHENGRVLGAARLAGLNGRRLRVGQPYAPPEPSESAHGRTILDGTFHMDTTHAPLPVNTAADEMRLAAAAPAMAQTSTLKQELQAELRRTRRLVTALENDLHAASEGDGMRRSAERAKGLLPTLPRGADHWILVDAWQPGGETLRVNVNPALPPAANVERLFHMAKRMERTVGMATPRLQQAKTRADKIEAFLALVRSDPDAVTEDEARELLAIRRRRPVPNTGKISTPRRAPFRAFTTSNGMRVLVGKTSKDNILLTHSVAQGNDVFLHARDAAGAHVVLLTDRAPADHVQSALEQAALLAAYHSKARGQGIVDVYITDVKHVKRVPGHPGLVTLAKQRVRRVRISPDKMDTLLATEQGAAGRVSR
jgi:predicted ribosome quality control (RQC) complex YloA/Tae2 family protein